MSRKKPKPDPETRRLQLVLPADWVAAIDAARGAEREGAETLSEWIRGAIQERLGKRVANRLSEMPVWGGRRRNL